MRKIALWSVLVLAFGLLAGCGQEGEVPDSEEVTIVAATDDGIGPLGLGMTDDLVISALGEPTALGEMQMWGADGEYHQTWEYPGDGLRLDMAGNEGDQVVYSITAEAPFAHQTLREIGIGSPRGSVEEAYADMIDPQEQGFVGEDGILAGSPYGGMAFYFDGDEVSSIFIGAMAE